jgi:diguanylate cyclase (GGDEF)-like protein
MVEAHPDVIAASVTRRGPALALAACGYAGVVLAFVLVERPGLGLGHFFYLPVCLIALATDAFGGVAAGIVAAGLYCLAVVVDPRIPSHDALTTATGIRAVTFALVGAVVGLYAHRNRELVAQLQAHATTDFVTGVGNVRAFDEALERRLAAGEPFSLVLVDIDGLRRVNEVHGHLAGDAALRTVASALSGEAGRDDLVARVGGDEFAVLTAGAPELAGRVNALLVPDDLTVTAAATSYPADGETADGLFRKADDRLFAAKLVRANRQTLAAV